ncbi:carbonic anhydrase [Microterricola pindariensis]|uniref:Carbonic anhydrase n=1 Tax=Microterricola pindariensis TaxID=478010 RepID=A0ABX5ARV8_9MICO|nr:carbonic anhydrase [Microterricola pindariensis]PPL14915.1 carbonic anhydrase [Microterricola pindariensis]
MSAGHTTATPSSTPAQAWAEMRAGNERFVAGKPLHPHQDVDSRRSLAGAQGPRAALFGCADSRLAAEIIFDVGLGDLFVVRNAGQVIGSSIIGSLEYAVGVLHVPLIVVLGHDSCGAVQAAIQSKLPDAAPLPHFIDKLVQKIVPAVERVTGGREITDASQVDAGFVGREHLRDTVSELLASSEMISDAVAAGTLAVVGANYRLFEGRAETDAVVGLV